MFKKIKDKLKKWWKQTLLFIGIGAVIVLAAGTEPDERLIAISNINDTLVADKVIDYTDNNTGENFIIKSDNKDYTSMGGDIMVYFSITNIADTQDGTILFSADQLIRSVERFIENEEYTVGKTATSSGEIKTRAIWENISIAATPNFDDKIIRKDTKDKPISKGFVDNFIKDETNNYRAVMNVPLETPQGDEWFIEVIGETDYGQLDPNLWVYEQLFNDLDNGGINGQDSWTYNTGSDNAIVTESGDAYEGTKWLSINTTTRTIPYRDFTGVVSGTFYVALQSPATDKSIPVMYVRNSGFASEAMEIELGSSGNITANDGVGRTDFFTSYSADTWYLITVHFETGAGSYEGLSADTYKADAGQGFTTFDMINAQTSIGSIGFDNNGYDPAVEAFIDSISPTDPTSPSDTCTYGGTGDHNVLESDNCYQTTDVYVDGDFNLIGGATGMFGCASGIKISAERFNFGGNTSFDMGCFAHH